MTFITYLANKIRFLYREVNFTDKDKIIEIMKSRGYEIHSFNPNYKYIHFFNDEKRLNCEVRVKEWREVTFEISKMIGMIKCTTQECGSLENEEHFNKFENWISKITKYNF